MNRLPVPQRVAVEFSRLLRDELTPAQMRKVVARNRRERSKIVCHSHDFCDANEVMAMAFITALHRPVKLSSPYDRGVWNRAWEVAASREFDTAAIAGRAA